ncbi:hypothetical protein MWMV7_MWMV7_03159 [Acinetobacter calcoaceticus]|nr:hypothetical protein MWMV7_MWMV7_03159 [Acinetobacter calcoaceticus]
MSYIHTFNFHKKTLILCKPNQLKPFQNVFTIITGNNATGKSRLLNSIISTTLDSPAYDFKKVIGISNTLNNKFPDFKNPKYIKLTNIEFSDLHKIKNNVTETDPDYFKSELYRIFINYGLPVNLTQPYTLNLEKILPFVAIKSIESPSILQKIKILFDFLEIKGNVKITFEIKNRNKLLKTLDEIIEKKEASDKTLKQIKKIFNDIQGFQNKTIYLDELIDYPACYELIRCGIINISKIRFALKDHSYDLLYRDLSSGQISILSLGLSLIYSLEDNSLVCIDEPEINLHPEWQKQIIKLIQKLSDEYKGCHFFIATHSPLLISNLNNQSFILDLSNNKLLQSIDIINRSSDFQLTEVFNFPGNNNEYLIRKLIIILNKINSDENFTFDLDSLKLLNHIKTLVNEEKFDKEDKVNILFNLIESYRG